MKAKASTRTFRRFLAMLALASWTGGADAQIVLPDADPTCPGEDNDDQKNYFSSWWRNGVIVDPPDLTESGPDPFLPTNDCAFYLLAERMFLWLTSPAPASDGSKLYVFDTKPFYQVRPSKNAENRRELKQNSPPQVLKMASASISQSSSLGGQVAWDSNGEMHPVVRADRDARSQRLLDFSRKPIETRHARISNGSWTFVNQFNKPISRLWDSSRKPIDFAFPFMTVNVGKNRFFLDKLKRLIVIDPCPHCQPAVLMSQKGGLVYYTIAVNDVYAYFLTVNDGKTMNETHFPVSAGDLQKVAEKAAEVSNFKTFLYPNVLTITVKFAWVEAATLSRIDNYITTWAMIPNYINPLDTKHWVRDGSNPWRKQELALVGMHIVFGLKDHTEMIWATVEHINNAPSQTYLYTSKKNKVPTPCAPEDCQATGAGDGWLFSSGDIRTPPVQHMYQKGDDIYAFNGHKIDRSDVNRLYPWGFDPSSNDPDENKAFNNTKIISINNSVRSKLQSGDVRENYILMGTLWKDAPTGPSRGSKVLANTTMETFFQQTSCLECHTGNMLGSQNGGGVSHIYGLTSPLR